MTRAMMTEGWFGRGAAIFFHSCPARIWLRLLDIDNIGQLSASGTPGWSVYKK
jgi:hypothetical protein